MDLTKKITDTFGDVAQQKKIVKETNEEGVEVKKEVEADATVGYMLANALLYPSNDTYDKVLKSYLLWKNKVDGKDEAEFTEEEKAFLREKVVAAYPPIFSGQVLELLA